MTFGSELLIFLWDLGRRWILQRFALDSANCLLPLWIKLYEEFWNTQVVWFISQMHCKCQFDILTYKEGFFPPLILDLRGKFFHDPLCKTRFISCLTVILTFTMNIVLSGSKLYGDHSLTLWVLYLLCHTSCCHGNSR